MMSDTPPHFTDTNAAEPPGPAGPGGVESHVVEAGDTLGSLAARYYGDAGQWRRILDANQDDIPDPGRLFPGRVLKIPAR